MASIKELLAEATQFKTGVQKLASGGMNKTASSDIVSEFADKLIAGDFESAPRQQIEKQAAQTDFCEKVAEAVMTIESLYSLALGKIKDDLIKEASSTGKTEAEIDQLVEKIAAKLKPGAMPHAVKMALGIVGFGSVAAGAGYAVGREHGRDKGMSQAKSMMMPTNSYGQVGGL
jgi:hypothetical protein